MLPPPSKVGERDLIEDYSDRGRISLLFIAAYLLGWIGVGIVFFRPGFWQLVVVNGAWSASALVAYRVKNVRQRNVLHPALIILTIVGAQTVWTAPSLQMPMQ